MISHQISSDLISSNLWESCLFLFSWILNIFSLEISLSSQDESYMRFPPGWVDTRVSGPWFSDYSCSIWFISYRKSRNSYDLKKLWTYLSFWSLIPMGRSKSLGTAIFGFSVIEFSLALRINMLIHKLFILIVKSYLTFNFDSKIWNLSINIWLID